MSIRVALHHKTEYCYPREVELGPQVVRLRPAPHCRTRVCSYSLSVTPQDHFLNWQQDPYGNYLARLVFLKPVRDLRVEVDLVAEMTVVNPFDFFLESSAEECPFGYEMRLARELQPYLAAEPPGPHLARFLEKTDRAKRRTVDFLVDLNQRLSSTVNYVIRMEPGVQTCEETLSFKRGSCRDSAWLLVQVLRHLGLAARFVSGYLIQLTADQKPLEGPAGPAADFTDLHAWAEVYLPGAGWVGLDPTSGLLAGEGHLPLACTPEPIDAAPITGSVEQSDCDFRFSMSVTRIHEDPRVTKPYTEEQWQSIERVGRRVDELLEAGDVRLTMGGEPTFVSIDDMEGDEWKTAAMGPTKRGLAGNLLIRLKDRFAPGGLLHFGQGKWYPGESLPRWALSCLWRADGEPVWRDANLLADFDSDYGHGVSEARRFTDALAQRLEVGPQHVVAAYEDAWYYLWRERRLPINTDVRKLNLDDAEERARIARAFEHGLNTPVGCVLPLRRVGHGDRCGWESGPWPVRAEQMSLVPGDSPMGLRLPLSALPWVDPALRHEPRPLDPFAARAPLPSANQFGRAYGPAIGAAAGQPAASAVVMQQAGGSMSGAAACQTDGETRFADNAGKLPAASHDPVIRTALCVEPRNRRLHVFLPPVDRLEDYFDLTAALEDTAAALDLPVVVEGYLPPTDHRLRMIKVTPDPGVIEVNVHPARNWQDLSEITTGLYDEARQVRLGTEKFDLDGRHTGTGGGNHVVLGGPTPADSPLLRRPDLLRSLLAYWNNHPALSYLFSCSFIGPTSQAPRVDEGRRDALYELKIAMEQIPVSGEAPPWLVDRAFRHLLVDVTGNTHRAEFCIDKLYSPDTASGRLGLLEFRGFEMPPHARMSLTQQLLLRGARSPILARALHRRTGRLGNGAARPLPSAALRLAGFRRRNRGDS